MGTKITSMTQVGLGRLRITIESIAMTSRTAQTQKGKESAGQAMYNYRQQHVESLGQ